MTNTGLLLLLLLLLALNVPHLVLLVLHIVNKDFLVCAHVLHYKVGGRVRQVSPRRVPISRVRPRFTRLRELATVDAASCPILRVVHDLGWATTSRAALAHQVSTAFRVR